MSFSTTDVNTVSIVTDIETHVQSSTIGEIMSINDTLRARTDLLTTTSQVSGKISPISDSCDTSHSATVNVHSVDISPSPDINMSDDLPRTSVSSEQWTCSPQEEQFMQSFDSTDSEVKAKVPRTSSTPVRNPNIYVKTESVSSHKRPVPTPAEIPTSHNPKARNAVDNLQLKVDCLIEKVQHGINWATTYISHEDHQSALDELSGLREAVLKSRTAISQQCAKLRLEVRQNTSTSS